MTGQANASKRWLGYVLCLGLGLVLGFVAGFTLTIPMRQKIIDVNIVTQLRLIGNALKYYAAQHGGHLPASLHDLAKTTDTDIVDPFSGVEFGYVGAGRTWGDFGGDGVIAYTVNHAADYQYALFVGHGVIRIGNSNLTEELRKISVTMSSNSLERPVAQPDRDSRMSN